MPLLVLRLDRPEVLTADLFFTLSERAKTYKIIKTRQKPLGRLLTSCVPVYHKLSSSIKGIP